MGFSSSLFSGTVPHWPMEFNFFRVLPKCVCLSLPQLVAKPALMMAFHLFLLAWALSKGLMLLSVSSCHSLFLCCHSRLLSFGTPLLVLIPLFLTSVVFLPSKGIIYPSPQFFDFLIPPLLVVSLLSHWNPSLSPHQPLGYPSALLLLAFLPLFLLLWLQVL